MRIFIVGPINQFIGGHRNLTPFTDAKEEFEKHEHTCTIPTDLVETQHLHPVDDEDEILALCKAEIDKCDAVALLMNWRDGQLPIDCFEYSKLKGKPVKTTMLWHNLFQSQKREVA